MQTEPKAWMTPDERVTQTRDDILHAFKANAMHLYSVRKAIQAGPAFVKKHQKSLIDSRANHFHLEAMARGYYKV